jgi:uncharacterized protein YacL (UPF0231 family)
MKKSIGTIGHVDHGKTTLTAALVKTMMKDNKVAIVDLPESGVGDAVKRILVEQGIENTVIVNTPEEFFTIAGEKYINNDLLHTGTQMYSRHIESLAMYGVNDYVRKLDSNTNIIKEFELIKQKKSKLSRWERDEVVRLFNKAFRKI